MGQRLDTGKEGGLMLRESVIECYGSGMKRMRSPKPKCVKCLSQDIYRAWHKDEWSCSYSDRTSGVIIKDEHLHYHCRGCSYGWTGPIAEKGG